MGKEVKSRQKSTRSPFPAPHLLALALTCKVRHPPSPAAHPAAAAHPTAAAALPIAQDLPSDDDDNCGDEEGRAKPLGTKQNSKKNTCNEIGTQQYTHMQETHMQGTHTQGQKEKE